MKHDHDPAPATGLPTRRTLLTALPAFGLAPAAALAVPSSAPSDTPILRLLRDHRAVIAGLAACPEDTNEAHQPFYDRSNAIQDEMMALPCTCAADFAAKFMVNSCEGDLYPERVEAEARALVGDATSVPAVDLAALPKPDPHPAWLAEWLQERDALDNRDMPQEAYDRRHDAWNELGDMIVNTRAYTAAGVAAQAEYALEDADGDTGPFIDVDRSLLANVLASLRRLA